MRCGADVVYAHCRAFVDQEMSDMKRKRKRNPEPAWLDTAFDGVASDDSTDKDWASKWCLKCLSLVTVCCTCFLCTDCLPSGKLTEHDDGFVACSDCAWYPCDTCKTKYCKRQSKPCERDDCCEWVHVVPATSVWQHCGSCDDITCPTCLTECGGCGDSVCHYCLDCCKDM